jgi:hypothetical protein
MKPFVTALLLLLPGAAHSQTNATPEQLSAITNIFNEHIRVVARTSRIIVERGKVVSVTPFQAEYIKQLLEVDASAAPMPFRIAWGDYVQSVLRRQRQDNRFMIGLLGAIVDPHFGITTLVGKVADKASQPETTQDYWYLVNRCAMTYGVDPAKIIFN